MNIKKYAQYFTESEILLFELNKFIKNKNGHMLEPSFGKGNIINYIIDNNKHRNIDCIEIDKEIDIIDNINKYNNINIIYEDFLKYNFNNKKYKTIVGNPPYIKQKNNINIYLQFIDKCIDILDNNGELIFIIPSDFFKLSTAFEIKNKMIKLGSFTDVFYPKNENLFKNVSQDIIIFRYEKDLFNNNIKYNNEDKYYLLQNGNIYFYNEFNINNKEQSSMKDIFHIKVGFISGLNNFFENALYGNEIIKTSSGDKKFLFYNNNLPNDKIVLDYYNENKNLLMNRKASKINENNWYKWCLLRNIKFIEENKNKECIYCSVLTRKKPVFFKGNIMYFDGSLLCLLPKIKINIDQYLKILNSEEFLNHFLYSGRYKIGQKALSEIFIRL